jgi:hypothetical protein
LHESEPDDQLAAKAKGNGACIQCHDKFREAQTLVAHTRHGAESSASECYNCHMPYTSYGILKAIRSHQISNPNVASDLTAGRPNACNLCHVDKTLAWTAEHLTKWYQQPKAPLAEEKISHIAKLALTGDAGQRVLAAWHFSWKPALQVSSTNFVQPFLAQLLDDPYAAVRCVAERSSKINGLPLPENYDYTIDPRTRPLVHQELQKRWQELMTNSAAKPQLKQFEALARQRDNRRVRLRE